MSGAASVVYRVRPDARGLGWIVCADGRVAHSLPYDTKEEALETARELAVEHAPSEVVVDERPVEPAHEPEA